MPGCVWCARGRFEVDAAFAGASLPGSNASREGKLSVRKRVYDPSACSARIGPAGKLEDHAEHVIRFLEEHYADLLKSVALEGATDAPLDFGYDCRLHGPGIRAQGEYLPARLVALCGELGLATMPPLYPSSSCSEPRDGRERQA